MTQLPPLIFQGQATLPEFLNSGEKVGAKEATIRS
jgi:hypothetical protein